MAKVSGILVGIALVVMCFGVICPAGADNSFYGPSGLFRVPTVDTVAPGSIDSSLYWTDELGVAIAANVGVTDTIELTPTWVDPEHGDSVTIISAKWRLWNETESRPGLAVGMFDFADEINISPYGVLEKHFTVGNTRTRVVAGLGRDDSLVDGLFVGAELSLGKGITALVEDDGENVNAGIRWPIGRSFMLTAGAMDNDLAAGLQYHIR